MAEAIASYDVQMVKLLIQHGADINQLSLSMDRAVYRTANNHELFPLVTPLNSAIRMLSGFIHTPLNEQDHLRLAAVEDIIEILLNHKSFNPDIRNEDRSTSLMVVAQTKSTHDQRYNRCNLVHQLIEQDININAQDLNDDTALIALFKQPGPIQDDGAFEKLLIKSGAYVNHQNSMGNTALMYSVMKHINTAESKTRFLENLTEMESLLQSGASLFIENKNGNCPLDYTQDLHRALWVSLFRRAQTQKSQIASLLYNAILIPHELINLIQEYSMTY